MAEDSTFAIDRALRQELESWQRTGLSHLPMPPRRPPAANPSSASVKPPTTRTPPSSRSNSRMTAPAATQFTSRPITSPQAHTLPVVSDPLPASPHAVGSLEDRQWRLNELRQRVAACIRCQELANARTQTVFGVGNPEARFLFIGEAPGADEDAQGEPFVGAAGQLLNKIIAACGLKREDIYICNILRCRPPGNRKPLPEEAGNCREWLDGQIAIVDPEFIVCWGATAAQNLMGTEESIGRLRGRSFQHGRATVLCTYHPSYLLRNPAAKKDVWEDMKLFLKQAGLPVPV